MKNTKHFRLLIVVFFVQLIAILSISLSHEMIRLTGDAYKLKIEGYDPIDPLRGRYLAYRIGTERVTGNLGDYTGKCYITLATDQDGYTYLDKAFKEKPKDRPYIVARRYGEQYYETPFTKYFLSEDIALKAETIMRDKLDKSYIIIKVKDGKSIVEGLYIEDKLIDNYFN